MAKLRTSDHMGCIELFAGTHTKAAVSISVTISFDDVSKMVLLSGIVSDPVGQYRMNSVHDTYIHVAQLPNPSVAFIMYAILLVVAVMFSPISVTNTARQRTMTGKTSRSLSITNTL